MDGKRMADNRYQRGQQAQLHRARVGQGLAQSLIAQLGVAGGPAECEMVLAMIDRYGAKSDRWPIETLLPLSGIQTSSEGSSRVSAGAARPLCDAAGTTSDYAEARASDAELGRDRARRPSQSYRGGPPAPNACRRPVKTAHDNRLLP